MRFFELSDFAPSLKRQGRHDVPGDTGTNHVERLPMGMTLEEKKMMKRGGMPLPLDPIALTIPQALTVLGLSRSGLYRAAAEGRIVLRKIGRSTIVDMESARRYIASLPVAAIGVARQPAAATNATNE